MREEPTETREALLRMLGGGRLTLNPLPDGCHAVNSVIFPLRLTGRDRRRKQRSPGAQGLRGS